MARTINFKKDIEQKQKMSISDVFDKFAKQGMSYHDVAAELGYSDTTIRLWSHKVGVNLKPSNRCVKKDPTVSTTIKDTLSKNWIKRDTNKCQENK